MCLVGELVHVNLLAVRLREWFWEGKRIDASLVVESVLGDVIVAEPISGACFLSFFIGDFIALQTRKLDQDS